MKNPSLREIYGVFQLLRCGTVGSSCSGGSYGCRRGPPPPRPSENPGSLWMFALRIYISATTSQSPWSESGLAPTCYNPRRCLWMGVSQENGHHAIFVRVTKDACNNMYVPIPGNGWDWLIFRQVPFPFWALDYISWATAGSHEISSWWWDVNGSDMVTSLL